MSNRYEVFVACCEDKLVHFFRVLDDREVCTDPICGAATSAAGPPKDTDPSCVACLPFVEEALGLPKDALSNFDDEGS